MGRIIEHILPAGSVVKLNILKDKYKNSTFLIIKRFVVLEESDTHYYEYEGMLLPMGSRDKKNIMFNQEQIAEILFEGYQDEIEKEFLKISEKIIIQKKMKKKLLK